jgi:hypothetical protein
MVQWMEWHDKWCGAIMIMGQWMIQCAIKVWWGGIVMWSWVSCSDLAYVIKVASMAHDTFIGWPMLAPVSAFQNCMLWEPEAMCLPSGEKTMEDKTWSPCMGWVMLAPVSTFQNCMFVSPAAICLPSGETAMSHSRNQEAPITPTWAGKWSY